MHPRLSSPASARTEPRDLDQHILELASRASRIAAAHSVRVAPHRFEGAILARKTFAEKQQLIWQLTAMIDFLPPLGGEPPTERELLQSALTKLGLAPYDRVLDYISDGDIVEIHSTEGIQIYRNLEMFKVCSFSLLELFTLTWDELYLRARPVIEGLREQVGTVFENPESGTVRCLHPQHVVTERSEHPYTIKLEFKYLSPLKSVETGQPSAVLTTKRGEVIMKGEESSRIGYI